MSAPAAHPPASLPPAGAPTGPTSTQQVRGFRLKVLVAMMLVVSAGVALALYVAERNFAANTDAGLDREFGEDVAQLHYAQALRHSALAERCRTLARKPRIHAALEDDALDLLYLSAADELRDTMAGDPATPTMRARFYRFLDRNGRLLPAPSSARAGEVDPAIAEHLALAKLRERQELGYFLGRDGGALEVIATPILSTETGEPIAALVLGFDRLDLAGRPELRRGLWVQGTVLLENATPAERSTLAPVVAELAARGEDAHGRVRLAGSDRVVFVRQLNPGSAYPGAFEVSLYSLEPFAAAERRLRLRIFGVGAVLLAGAFVTSQWLARRLAVPVERLALDSERSARFSADASHQLKTPVTVLRAGLEELLAREHLSPEECNAISALIHQTYRLSSLIDDLLLLSRMDSGRLRLALVPVDLGHLIAAALDDLSATPDGLSLAIETELPDELYVLGERRYTAIILQNLLENARKYNRPGGTIRVVAERDGEWVGLRVANTGRPIPAAAQTHIFERFHRGAVGENVPGYGLGLNLARELARLHLGELRLVRSDEGWTEFAVRLRAAPAPAA